MELATVYVEVRKKRNDPHLSGFLNKYRNMPLYQQKALQQIASSRPELYYQMGRRSGKESFHAIVSDDGISWAQPDPIQEAINASLRQAAQAMEQRIYNEMMYGTSVLENGSIIRPMQAESVARGSTAPKRIGSYEELVRLFGSPTRITGIDWAGDRDGDVPPVPHDSSE